MITPITATFPALNFPKEVDYPTQEDWAAFSAAAELNYRILSGAWSDKSEEFKEQTNNLAQEIQAIGENVITAITLDTVDDLATYTGTGLVIVKDIDRGGNFVSKTGIEINPNTGSLYVANGGTVFAKLGGGFWVRQYSGALNVKWFGAKGDWNGTNGTDDTVAIQKALEYSILNKKCLDFDENVDYLITDTLLLPVNTGIENSYKAPLIINGRGSSIVVNSNIPLLDSAYYNGAVLTSSISTLPETNMSFGVIIENLGFENIFNGNTEYAVRLKDWHQGSIIRNCAIRANAALDMYSCFYSKALNIITSGVKINGLSRFRFRSNNNLMEIKGLVAVDSNIGYYFDGVADAINFYQNSIEGVDIGVIFNSEVRSINIDSNYIENVTDTMFKFNSYVFSATIDNNYCNFLNDSDCYLIDYVPLHSNNITIGNGNNYVDMHSDYNFFKTKDNTLGYSKITLNLAPTTSLILDDLYVNNTNFSTQLRIDKIIHTLGSKAKVVNEYAEAQYAGRFTSGYSTKNGFGWVNTETSTLQLNTKFVESDTSRIYINIRISSDIYTDYAGEFIKYSGTWKFYKFTEAGLVLDTGLSIAPVDGFLQVSGTLANVVVNCVGEMRLI